MGDFDSDVHQVGAGRKEAHVDDFTSKLKIGCARVQAGCGLVVHRQSWHFPVKVSICREKEITNWKPRSSQISIARQKALEQFCRKMNNTL
jgi:hypothetical protein